METMFNNISNPYSWKPADLIDDTAENSSKLFLGNIGSFNDKIFLLENKIRAIVSVLSEPIHLPDHEIILDHMIISINDSEKSEILNDLDNVSNFIQKNRDLGHNILVHCMAGSSRSASFVIAYLMRKNKWCFEKAYLFVRNKRPQVFPNSGFMRQLRMYEKKLFNPKENEKNEKTDKPEENLTNEKNEKMVNEKNEIIEIKEINEKIEINENNEINEKEIIEKNKIMEKNEIIAKNEILEKNEILGENGEMEKCLV